MFWGWIIHVWGLSVTFGGLAPLCPLVRATEHEPILVIFGRHRNQKMLYLPPHPTSASALPGKKETKKLSLYAYKCRE